MTAVPQPEDDKVIKYENREFCVYGVRNRVNCAPVDDEEDTRMDEQNRILNNIVGGPIIVPFPPRGVTEPEILDCGFGNHAWIDGLLADNEDWQFTGIDIFLGERDDSDEEDEDVDAIEQFDKRRYNFNASLRDSGLGLNFFHLINSRCLIDGIDAARWPGYIRELKQMLIPGGWIQLIEIHHQFQSAAGRPNDYPMLVQWWELYKRALTNMGKDYQRSRQLRALLAEARFEAVHERVVQLPIGDWKTGFEDLGADNLTNVLRMISSWSLIPFRRILGMNNEMYNSLIRGAAQELYRPELKLYFNVYVAYGRRPKDRR